MKKLYYLMLLILLFSQVLPAQVAVIANKSVPINQISKKQLLDIYTGDIRQWDNRKPVVVFDLKTKGEVKETFYDFLGKSPSRMKSIWLKKMLSGEGDPPKSLSSENEILKIIKETPGSIGFVSQSLVDNDVKVLIVIN